MDKLTVIVQPSADYLRWKKLQRRIRFFAAANRFLDLSISSTCILILAILFSLGAGILIFTK